MDGRLVGVAEGHERFIASVDKDTTDPACFLHAQGFGLKGDLAAAHHYQAAAGVFVIQLLVGIPRFCLHAQLAGQARLGRTECSHLTDEHVAKRVYDPRLLVFFWHLGPSCDGGGPDFPAGSGSTMPTVSLTWAKVPPCLNASGEGI